MGAKVFEGVHRATSPFRPDGEPELAGSIEMAASMNGVAVGAGSRCNDRIDAALYSGYGFIGDQSTLDLAGRVHVAV